MNDDIPTRPQHDNVSRQSRRESELKLSLFYLILYSAHTGIYILQRLTASTIPEIWARDHQIHAAVKSNIQYHCPFPRLDIFTLIYYSMEIAGGRLAGPPGTLVRRPVAPRSSRERRPPLTICRTHTPPSWEGCLYSKWKI